MARKAAASATLVTLVCLTGACVHTYRTVAPSAVERTGTVEVKALRTKSGEYYEFKPPAVLAWGAITARGWKTWRLETITVDESQVREVIDRPGAAVLVTRDGRRYGVEGEIRKSRGQWSFVSRIEADSQVIELDRVPAPTETRVDGQTRLTVWNGTTYVVTKPLPEDAEHLRFEGRPTVLRLSIAEVDQLRLRRVDRAASFGLTVLGCGVATAALVGIMVAALASEQSQSTSAESCPFIYSFDGGQYVFDAEPCGGAVCRGMKRTEWCNLEHLRESGGRYRLRITNEVDETQHTDELKLLVVDHPSGTQIVPDEAGRLHVFSHPEAPSAARDRLGRDVLPLLAANDWVFWHSRVDENDPAWGDNLREELTLEFPKPQGAAQARLLFNGCNTLWASQMLKRYLGLWGSEVPQVYARLDSSPPLRDLVEKWNLREEVCRLKLRVEGPRGWETRGTIVGGGPFMSEDKAYVIDVGDIEGERLVVRLTPPAGFWMINSLAVDYGDEVAVDVTELSPRRATDRTGADVLEGLLRSDDSYLSMPNTGDSAEVVFDAPPLRAGRQRSFVVKATGYYDIHLRGEGPVQRQVIQRYLLEPGFVARYALDEYRRWAAETRAAAFTE